ncbi:MAG: hypothetical protein FAZ92_00841 [Accumulibacter sp.]|jgi:hypothetical protein|nr:MAG: hypothetical protein FAZ92_00841 [Accumulibacter sp.]
MLRFGATGGGSPSSGKRNCGKCMPVGLQLSRPFSESLIVYNISILNLQ